jgi:WD40 repeat protein
LRGHTGPVTSVAFTANGRVLASASAARDDYTIKLWDARTGQELRTLRGHKYSVTSVAFFADGQILASASADKTIKLWDARTGQELRTLRGHRNTVASVGCAADGQMLASASADKTIKLWDARTGQQVRTLRGHSDKVWSVAFAADGQVVASASWDRTIKLWDTRTGEEFRTLRGNSSWVTSMAFAPGGRVLAALEGGQVRLWDTQTCQVIHTLFHTMRGETRWVTRFAFVADGKTLWTFADGKSQFHPDEFGSGKAWDVATGAELAPPWGAPFDLPPIDLAYAPHGPGDWSPDGRLLAVGQDNGLVLLVPRAISENERRFRLWVTAPDLHLHRELAEQAGNEKQPLALAFRLGRYLAAKNYYATEPKEAATLVGWLGTAAQPPGLLPGLPAVVKTHFHEPTFPDGIACTGVLCKESSIAPARLLIGTSRALQGDSTRWLNHAFHGGALLRSGEHAKALAALNEAIERHGKPHPLTHSLLALTHLQMGETAKAKAALAQAEPAKDAPFPDAMLHRLFQPEIDAALAKAEGKDSSKEK